MGRPRTRNKDLPLGMRQIAGRYYVRPMNREMHRIFAIAFPGKVSAPLGADKNEARKLYVKLFLTDMPIETGAAGTVGELLERYEREIMPGMHPRTAADHTAYLKNLRIAFAHRAYAKSEVEAGTPPYRFVRTLDITKYLRAQAKVQVFHKDGRLIADGRPVVANKEIKCLGRIFRLAKSEWGCTEYNPTLQVEFNPESAREEYHDDVEFMRVYEKASPLLQGMMDLAQMNGSRKGMLLRMTLADITPEGVWTTLNKQRKADPKRPKKPKRKFAPWTDDLRDVVARIMELRAKVRGGQKKVDDMDTAPLFLNRGGKAVSVTGFNSMWQRAARAAGFGKDEFHFHDIKAKALSDSPTLANAQERGDHTDGRMTQRVYRRKPASVIPLPRVSKKGRDDLPVEPRN